jgi:hypothetical protein
MDTFEPYEQVKQATAQLMRALADQVPGVESLWVRHESHARAVDDPLEVAREWSFVLESGFVLSVRARWYDVNAEGWRQDHELVYDRLVASLDAPESTPESE